MMNCVFRLSAISGYYNKMKVSYLQAIIYRVHKEL